MDGSIVYFAREKPLLGRAPTLQIFHTLRGIHLAGGRVRYVTPWSERLIRRRCRELIGHELPDEIEVISLGPGPNVPFLSQLSPGPVWSGISARLQAYLRGVRQREPDAVVYTRNRRAVAALSGGGYPPVLFEYHEARSVTVAESGTSQADRVVAARISSEERIAMSNCAALITVSRFWAEEARTVYRFLGPVWTIPNAADPAIFGISPEERRPVPGRLLYIGSLAAWKGLDLALQAVSRVPGVELHICGGESGSAPWRELVKRSQALGISQRVTLHGTMPQPKLRPLLATAAAGLLPLDGRYAIAASYTSPLKLFEYLCAGLPVVATDLPSVREIIGHTGAGLLFAQQDVDDLATCLRAISTDAALARRLGENARVIGAQHTWQRRGERVIEACGEIRAAGRRRASKAA